ncbi:MAG: metallophosphoesterase [Planctomycetota bacterium]|nr:metallophosphoesterase [Planctomycetota bacterium]
MNTTAQAGATRREVLAGMGMAGLGVAGLAAGLGAMGLPGVARAIVPRGAERRRVLRIAHLTDTHVQPERKGMEGMAACLRHAQSSHGTIDLVLAGGDNVMDVMGNTRERGDVLRKAWTSVLSSECSAPVESCVGNHDVWGWKKDKSKTTGSEALWGKKWALDAYGLPAPYRHFDRNGWRFVLLDSTFPDTSGHSYTARLDDEQFAWLETTLRDTPAGTPVLVLSHIPIICACAMFDGDNETSGDWKIPGAWMHTDARRIKDLFRKHPNVKVCLSGHIHLVDRVDYLGVTYFCNGAVSGGWWKGPYQECEPGYGLVDLYDDGSFENRYVTYGWTAADKD